MSRELNRKFQTKTQLIKKNNFWTEQVAWSRADLRQGTPLEQVQGNNC